MCPETSHFYRHLEVDFKLKKKVMWVLSSNAKQGDFEQLLALAQAVPGIRVVL